MKLTGAIKTGRAARRKGEGPIRCRPGDRLPNGWGQSGRTFNLDLSSGTAPVQRNIGAGSRDSIDAKGSITGRQFRGTRPAQGGDLSCRQRTIYELDAADVTRLSETWHAGSEECGRRAEGKAAIDSARKRLAG